MPESNHGESALSPDEPFDENDPKYAGKSAAELIIEKKKWAARMAQRRKRLKTKSEIDELREEVRAKQAAIEGLGVRLPADAEQGRQMVEAVGQLAESMDTLSKKLDRSIQARSVDNVLMRELANLQSAIRELQPIVSAVGANARAERRRVNIFADLS